MQKCRGHADQCRGGEATWSTTGAPQTWRSGRGGSVGESFALLSSDLMLMEANAAIQDWICALTFWITFFFLPRLQTTSKVEDTTPLAVRALFWPAYFWRSTPQNKAKLPTTTRVMKGFQVFIYIYTYILMTVPRLNHQPVKNLYHPANHPTGTRTERSTQRDHEERCQVFEEFLEDS